MGGIDYRELRRAIDDTDKIVTSRLTQWLLTESDTALDQKVAEKILDLLTTEPRYRGQSFSASSATYCLRAQVFGYLDALSSSHDARLMNIFMDGKWRHLRWQAMGLMSGILSEIEFPLDWPNRRSKGSMDGIGVVPNDHPRLRWRGKEFGFELKGMNSMTYMRMSKDESLKPEHVGQIARYFLLSGLPLFVYIVEDKSTQAWFEVVAERDDPKWAEAIREQEWELGQLNDAIDTETLPGRIPPCMKLSGPTFNDCGYGGRAGVCATVTHWPKRGTLGSQRPPKAKKG